jgi:hypothetical protein
MTADEKLTFLVDFARKLSPLVEILTAAVPMFEGAGAFPQPPTPAEVNELFASGGLPELPPEFASLLAHG